MPKLFGKLQYSWIQVIVIVVFLAWMAGALPDWLAAAGLSLCCIPYIIILLIPALIYLLLKPKEKNQAQEKQQFIEGEYTIIDEDEL